MSKARAVDQLSDHELIVVLAGYLESQAASSPAALILHTQLGPKLARIIAGEQPRNVLHTAARGRPVAHETLIWQSVVASYIAWRRQEGGLTKKQAVAEVARILKISDDTVLNANRALSDDALASASALFEGAGTPAQVLKAAHAAHISKAKKISKKPARGK